MGFLFKLLFFFALLCFVFIKSLEATHDAPEHETQKAAMKGRRQEKEGPVVDLRKEAAAKLGAAAREYCLKNPGDCFELVKAAGAEAAKRGANSR